jgi:acyl carrier protein
MGMDTVELLWKIEKRYGIAIPNEEAAKMDTVQEICNTVMRHLPKGTDYEKIYKEIREIVADHAGIEVQNIEPHHSITNDLGLD